MAVARPKEPPRKPVVVPEGHAQALHRHPGARLVLFLDGCLRERAIAGAETCRAGDFVIRPAWFGHDALAARGGARYVNLPLSDDAALSFFAQFGWSARRGRVWLGLGEIDELLADSRAGDAILLHSETQPYARHDADNLAAAAARLRRPEDAPDMAQEAERCGVPPWELTRRFARAFGLTPTKYRMAARAEAALKLIAESDLSLAGIAAQAGYADQSHLTRGLRIETGKTPAALRRQLAL